MKIFIWISSFFIIVGIPDALLIEFYDIEFGAIPTILLAGVAYLTAKTLCKKWDIHKASRENSDNKENNIQNECTVFDSNAPTNEASKVKVPAVAKRKKTTSLINTETDIIHTDGSSALDSVKTTNKKNSIINKFTVAILFLCILLTASVAINAYMAYSNSILQENIETLNQAVENKTALFNSANSNYIDLRLEYIDIKADLSFYEKHVVIVPNDNKNTYHIYGCKYCDTSYFWAYNTKAAQDSGYSPCKYCCK